MRAIPHAPLPSGVAAGIRLLFLGTASALPAPLAAGVRSLKIEHVSPDDLLQQEICRGTPIGRQADQARRRGVPVPDQTLLAVLRRWFWTRKPDAGFLLAGFPATLLHARVFDEWLEARAEALTGCLCPEPASAHPDVVAHYRTMGLLCESLPAALDR